MKYKFFSASLFLLLFHALPLKAALLAVQWDSDSPVYRIDECTGVGALVGRSGALGLNSLARDVSGKLFSVGFDPAGSYLATIDASTGRATHGEYLRFQGDINEDVRGLAFSPGGVLFAINNSSSGIGSNPDDLFTIDVNTGVGTLVGRTGFNGIQGLDFSPDGTLYGWDVGNGDGIGAGLVRINPITGAAVDVDTSVSGSGRIQTLAFAPDGTLYGAGDALYKIDVATGTATVIGGGGYSDVRGLAVLPGAPTLAIHSAVEICWCAQPNKHYQLQWTSEISKTWQNLGQAIGGTGSNYCTFDSSRSSGKRFYRVIESD
jgi:hypothetical protein